MSAPEPLNEIDIGEMMHMAAEASLAGFTRVQADPQDIIELCELALITIRKKAHDK